jgi:hypothetical protein
MRNLQIKRLFLLQEPLNVPGAVSTVTIESGRLAGSRSNRSGCSRCD